jgi:hypothetical protein
LTTDIVNLTCPTKLIFAYSLKVVHRLSTLQDPGWDPAIVRQTVDIAGLLDRCAAVALEANDRLKAETGEGSKVAEGIHAQLDAAESGSSS